MRSCSASASDWMASNKGDKTDSWGGHGPTRVGWHTNFLRQATRSLGVCGLWRRPDRCPTPHTPHVCHPRIPSTGGRAVSGLGRWCHLRRSGHRPLEDPCLLCPDAGRDAGRAGGGLGGIRQVDPHRRHRAAGGGVGLGGRQNCLCHRHGGGHRRMPHGQPGRRTHRDLAAALVQGAAGGRGAGHSRFHSRHPRLL